MDITVNNYNLARSLIGGVCKYSVTLVEFVVLRVITPRTDDAMISGLHAANFP